MDPYEYDYENSYTVSFVVGMVSPDLHQAYLDPRLQY